MTPAWHDFQEQVAAFLNAQPNVTAETNVTVQGARTSHDIDVEARFTALGAPVTWHIECKFWKKKVPKEKALAFRQIVADTGVDRGLLIAPNGYQSGTIKAVRNSNVELITFESLKNRILAESAVNSLTNFIAKLAVVNHRYWQHSKSVRKEYDLRLDPYSIPSTGMYDHYPVNGVLGVAAGVIDRAQLRIFPLTDLGQHLTLPSALVGPRVISDIFDAVEWLEANVDELERRMDEAENQMSIDGTFFPAPGGHMTFEMSTAMSSLMQPLIPLTSAESDTAKQHIRKLFQIPQKRPGR